MGLLPSVFLWRHSCGPTSRGVFLQCCDSGRKEPSLFAILPLFQLLLQLFLQAFIIKFSTILFLLCLVLQLLAAFAADPLYSYISFGAD